MEGTTEDRVKKVITEHLAVQPEQVTPDARLEEDLSCDCLDLVDLVMGLEEEFRCEIDDSELKPDMTVQDAVNLIEQKTKKTAQAA